MQSDVATSGAGLTAPVSGPTPRGERLHLKSTSDLLEGLGGRGNVTVVNGRGGA
jgi:hypothetical protein